MAGLAFGAFHHFIYAPYQAGTRHGVAALGKAGLAAVFTVHELQLAKADAESSPTLCHLAAPFDKASTAISSSTNQRKPATPATRTSTTSTTTSTQSNTAPQPTGSPHPTGPQ